jgi:inorganic pyrophosphatase
MFEFVTHHNSTNTTVSHSISQTNPASLNIPKGEDWNPAPVDPAIDKWFFISGAPSA